MNLKRLFRFNFTKFGENVCLFSAAMVLIQLLTIVFTAQGSLDIGSIVASAINFIFYLSIYSFFRKGDLHFGYVYQAVVVLLFWDYVFPFVITLIDFLIGGTIQGIDGISLDFIYSFGIGVAILILGSLVSVLFFFFTIKENKTKSIKYQKILFILGIILLVSGLIRFFNDFTYSIMGTIEVINLGLETKDLAMSLVGIGANFLTSISSLLYSILYFNYPRYLKTLR